MKNSEIFRKAGEIIMHKGIAYGSSRDVQGRVCMMGALSDASPVELGYKAVYAFSDYLETVYGPEYSSPAAVNDEILLEEGEADRERAKVEAACLFYEAAAYAKSKGQ